jgi:recombination protein RecT
MAEEKKGGNGAVPATKTGDALAINQQSVTDIVGAKMNQWLKEGAIVLPRDYSIQNAMKFAWLELQTTKDLNDRPLFVDGKMQEEVGTKNSLVAALLNMAVQGMNVGKDQGYFVIFAKQVTFMRSYFGTETLTKTLEPKVKDFASAVIREGDEITYDMQYGKITNLVHKTNWANRSKPILGAYAVALDADGKPLAIDIMSIEEIHQSWKQSKGRPFDDQGKLKPSSYQAKFPVEACKKTVLNRLCKPIINTSTDKEILLTMIKTSDELADRAMVEDDIGQLANQGEIIDVTADAPALGSGTEAAPGNGAEADPPPEGEKKPDPVETYRLKMDNAPEFVSLNNARDGFMEDKGLSEEEKKGLHKVYQANGKRLSGGGGKKETPPDELEKNKEAVRQGAPF